jgi:ABC-type transport system involved in multi-copper enzyme maturation permease subunit
MKDLLRWEMKQTLRSKAFWGMGIAFLLCVFLFLIEPLYYKTSGYDMFLLTMNNFNAFVIFFTGIYAGIHITKAFETRNVQAAVMAGNSRFNILLAKFISYSTAVAIYSVISMVITTALSFAMGGVTGLDGSFARMIIARAAVFTVVEIAYAATCFFASMFIRHQDGAIGLNTGLMLMSNVGAQILLNFDWAEKFVRLTPAGQSMFIIADMSNSNIAMALATSVVAIAAVIALSYVKFRREELK